MGKPDVADLYMRYGYLVHRRCSYLLHQEDEAMDAVHDVFIKVIKYSYSFKHRNNPVPWLLQIANRICFDMLRKRSGTESIGPGELVNTQASGQEDRSLVIDILQTLDKKTQDIVLYYFLEEMTMEEISKRIGISRKTIGRKIQKFTRSMRTLLEHDQQ